MNGENKDLDSQSEPKREIILGLLNEVERNSAISQRTIAHNLDVALGIANAYLKRCTTKGYIKVTQAPANRYLYYLTPTGFAEKSRLTAEYLTQSFGFFRTARRQCTQIIDDCISRGLQRLALAGHSDLAEIMVLCATGRDITLVGIADQQAAGTQLAGLRVAATLSELPAYDAVVVTCLRDPAFVVQTLSQALPPSQLLVPPLLKGCGLARQSSEDL